MRKFALLMVAAFATISSFGAFNCMVVVPAGDLGESRTATITYSNGGSSAIAAPYVRIEADDNAYVRFSEADAWSKSVEFLATSDKLPASSLQAGETVNVPVFVYTDTEEAQLTLSYTQSSAEAFPWSDIGASLKPSYVTSDAWTFALVTLKSRLGTTWNTYLDRLRSDADYLAGLGRRVNRVDSLLQIEINQALGVDAVLPELESVTDAARSARGVGLSFTRSYSSAMYSRFAKGILGYGWSDNLSAYAELVDAKTLVFRIPGGGSYAFTKETGSWQPEDARDKTVLSESSSAYTLTYQNGTVQTVAKSNMRTSSISDNCGSTLTFTWSGTTLQRISHTDGQSLSFVYSGGLLASVTDDCGRKTSYTYSNSLLTKVTRFDGLSTTYEYRTADGTAASRALTRIVYPDGTAREFTYDGSSGLVSAVSSNGGKERSSISRDGGIVTLTGPDGAVTTVKTGVSGEMLETTDALGGVSTKRYTDDGLLKAVVSPSGLEGTISHDDLGRVSKSVSAAGAETRFAYEETFGNLRTVTDAKNHSISYGYDAKGLGTSVAFADGTSSAVEYNSRGDVVKSTNRRGQSITYSYDAKGRLTKKTWSSGRIFTYAYDARDNVTTASDSETGTVSMQYDSADRLTRIAYPKGRGFTFVYDECGRLADRTSFDGSSEHFSYDSQGRLVSVSDVLGKTYLRNTYDATTGRLTKQVNGNGTSVSYLYDRLGRVVSIEHCDADGNIVESLQYCYDADGRCIRASSLLGEERYGYDKDGQLTAVEYPDDTEETFAYDAVGNRTAANGTTYAVNNLNQYTSVSDGTYMSYDLDGNLIWMMDGNGATSYYYDALNRLVAVTNTAAGIRWSCRYDVFGNRVSVTDNGVTTERTYLQGSLPSVAAEYVNGQLKERHIVVGAVRLASLTTHNSQLTTSFYHADLIGSTRLVTDGDGAIVDRRAYKAFGEMRVGEDANSTAGYVGTLGVETDSTGLLFMRNRYYSPKLGRFIQMDPIGLCGNSINLYSYVDNTPLQLIDPNGNDWWQFTKDFTEGFFIGAGKAAAWVGLGFTGIAAGAVLVGGIVGGTPVAGAAALMGMTAGAIDVGSRYIVAGIQDENVDALTVVDSLLLAHNAFKLDKLSKAIGARVVLDTTQESTIENLRKAAPSLGEMTYDVLWNSFKQCVEGQAAVEISSNGHGGGGEDPNPDPEPGPGNGLIMNAIDWMRFALADETGTATYSLGADLTLDWDRKVAYKRYEFYNDKFEVTRVEYQIIGYAEDFDEDDYDGAWNIGYIFNSRFCGKLKGNGHKLTVKTVKGINLFLMSSGAWFEDVIFDGPSIGYAEDCIFKNVLFIGDGVGAADDCILENVIFSGDGVGTAEGCTFVRSSSKTYPLTKEATWCVFSVCNSVSVNINGGGAIAESAKDCTFINCSVEGSLNGRNGAGSTGGIAGFAVDCTFRNCISKVSVVGWTIGSYLGTGGLVGYATSSSFEDCISMRSVDGDWHTGGFVGYSAEGSTFCNCRAEGDVTGSVAVGGFAGEMSSHSSATSCTATGRVLSTGICPSDAGGFVGTLVMGCVVAECEASGDVSSEIRVGGFIGSCRENMYEADKTSIMRCCASGAITGGSYVGGFAGLLSYCTVADCCALGPSIANGYTLNDNWTEADVGGFACVEDDIDIGGLALRHCYARGKVTTTIGFDIINNVFGIAGGLLPGSMSNTYYLTPEQVQARLGIGYWNITTTGQDESGGGIGLTTAEAKSVSSYVGWDFENVWRMGVDGPELRNLGATITPTPLLQSVATASTSCLGGSQNECSPKNLSVAASTVKPESPRLYTYERYVAVKDFAYYFVVSADDNAVISVSGLPAGFSFADGMIFGSAASVGTSTVTITAVGSSGTATKCVPFVVIPTPVDFEQLQCHDIGFATFPKWNFGYSMFTTLDTDADVFAAAPVNLFDKGDSFYIVHGYGNFGDDAIVGADVATLRELISESGETVFSDERVYTENMESFAGIPRAFIWPDWAALPAGVYEAVVTLDSKNSIGDTNRANNVRTYLFAIRDAVPINDALGCTDLVFQTDADDWYGTRDGSDPNLSYARTKHLGSSGTNVLTAVASGAGKLSFDWKVSSEEDYDWLEFLIDGVIVNRISGEDSGRCEFVVDDRDHTFLWRYSKDDMYYDGLDCAWVGNVAWSSVATVTFDVNGVGAVITDKTRTVKPGNTVGTLPTPVRAGYQFNGWYTAPEGGTKITATTKVTGDVSYYAHWSAAIVPVVMHGCDGMGTVSGGGVIAAGKKATLKATANKGYVFAGWYDGAGNPLSGGVDYRTATYPYVSTGEPTEITARFVTTDEDAASLKVVVYDNSTEDDGSYELDLGHRVESLTIPKLAVTGLPAGLKYDAKTMSISGKATKPGVYTVTVKATNASVTKAKEFKFDITVPNLVPGLFKEAGYAADGVYELEAGAAPDLSGVIQAVKGEGWKIAVSGLPAGLKYDDKASAVTGVATKEGAYTVTFTVTKGREKEIATATFKVAFPTLAIVTEALYDASATDGAKVVGGGKYPVGAKVSLKATPGKNCVFAGWYDAYGKPLAGDADYRNATYAYVTTNKDVTITAKFVAKQEDVDSLTVNLTDVTASAAGELEMDLSDTNRVSSHSLPKLTVTGLPAGVKYDATTMKIAGKATMPGVYTVTVKATNASVTKAQEFKFDITVPNLVPGLFKEAGYAADGVYELEAGAAPDLSGVIQSVKGEGWKVAVSGLPAGLKYDDKNSAVTGAATKEGAYTVTFTVTKGREKEIATATFKVAFPTLAIVTEALYDASATDGAKVVGGGKYPVGAKVSLKATPGKNCLFAGWYDGEELLSQAASYTYETTKADKTLTAKFATVSEDKGSIRLGLGGKELDDPSVATVALATNVTCGVVLEWPLSAFAYSAKTITVAGLPAGLKFTAKDIVDSKTKAVTVPANTIYGAPTTASAMDKKTGLPKPSDVKITVTTAGKSSVTYLVKLTVDPLPAWAVGSFEGPAGSGSATMSVTAAGKVAGKFALGGTNWTFKADSYSAASETVGATNLVVTAVATAGKATMPVDLALSALALDYLPSSATARAAGTFGDAGATLCRLVWTDKGDADAASLAASYAGAYSFVAACGELEGDVTLTLSEKGAIKGSAAFPDGAKTRKATFAANALPEEDGLHIVVALPPDAKKGCPAVFEDRLLVPWSDAPDNFHACRDPGAIVGTEELNEGSGASGTVTVSPKYGQVAAGKPVTLTAKADKGSVFSRWEIEGADTTGLDLSAATLKYVSPGNGDVVVVAKFVTAAEDRAAVALTLDGVEMRRVEDNAPYQTNVCAGVYLEWPVAVDALSQTTVKVAGLPAGLKFTAKDIVDAKTKAVTVPANTIYGAPTTASAVDKKTGLPKPSEVKITVMTAGKSSVVYLLKLTVDPLPGWFVGSYIGVGGLVKNKDYLCTYDFSGTINASGKLSGTFNFIYESLITGAVSRQRGSIAAPYCAEYYDSITYEQAVAWFGSNNAEIIDEIVGTSCFYYRDVEGKIASDKVKINMIVCKADYDDCGDAIGVMLGVENDAVSVDDAWELIAQNVWARKDISLKPVFASATISKTMDIARKDNKDLYDAGARRIVFSVKSSYAATAEIYGVDNWGNLVQLLKFSGTLYPLSFENGVYECIAVMSSSYAVVPIPVSLTPDASGKISAQGMAVDLGNL